MAMSDHIQGAPVTGSIYFSVITPFYNRKDTLLRAIDSCLVQSYPHYELILIDDGSTDGALHAIGTRYRGEMATGRIQLIHCPHHQGAAAARNLALTQAKNPWIFYLDSDNYLYPDALSVLAKAITQHPLRQLFYGCCDMASNGERGHSIPFNRQKLLKKNFIDLGVFVHARIIFEKLGGFDTKLKRLMDWEMMIRYTQTQDPVFIPHSLMVYNDKKEDQSRITNKESLEEAFAYIRQKHPLQDTT